MKKRLAVVRTKRTSENDEDGIALRFAGTVTDLVDDGTEGKSTELLLSIEIIGSVIDQITHPSTGQKLSLKEKEKYLFYLAVKRLLPKIKSGTAKTKEHFVIDFSNVLPGDRNVANLDKLPDPTTWSLDVEVDPPRIDGFGST